MHAGLDENHPSVWLSQGSEDARLRGWGRGKSDSRESSLQRFTTAVLEAVLLTRKWDFQEEETASENEVTR